MKRLFYILLCTFFCSTWAFGQGKVTITEQAGISALMSHYIKVNKNTATVEGWRIQLMATTDRQEMEMALNRFRSRYPSISVDWVHAKPYYKIRAGAFNSKMDALRVLYILKQEFPSAYPAMDNTIRPYELLY
ncbi:MAG: SPOR domain-containing protein [Phaeodactylibacter sp.]|nr:SPOR domain-containing protein [Phaeodactylibacter sp.]